jgi:glycosyltransferase involved in cell wall biosynthesis
VPRFSVIVPAYNAEPTLAETLDAVLAQTFGDWECIVVDDGSTDATLRVALACAQGDPRFRVLHQANQGSGGAYNTGVSSATGDFVVLCSADDILLPLHLARMSGFIDRERGYDIYSSNGYFWRPGDSRQLVYGAGERETVHSLSLADVILCCFYSVGAIYRRELFSSVGGYRPDVFGEDYDFWLRAMASGARHRYLPEALSLHRVSPEQKSARLETAYRSDIRLVSDLRRDFPLRPEDRRAVEECIRDREHLIARLDQPAGPVPHGPRAAAVSVARRLLGERTVRRLSRRLRSLTGRTPGAGGGR